MVSWTAPSSARIPGSFMSSAPATDLTANCNASLPPWSTVVIDSPERIDEVLGSRVPPKRWRCRRSKLPNVRAQEWEGLAI